MAYKRISPMYFMADSKKDLDTLPESFMGAECFVIEEACEYKRTSAGKWIKQAFNTTNNSSIDLTGYATEEYVINMIGEYTLSFATPDEVKKLVEEVKEEIALTTEDILDICK